MFATKGETSLNSTLNQTTSGSPGKNKGARRHQNVVPLLIKQIIKEEGQDDLYLFNMPIQLVKLVGVIRDIRQESTHTIYTLQDFTGIIKVIHWMENAEDSESMVPAVKVNDRVKIFGKVREREGELMVMLLRMFPVVEANIVTAHIMENRYATLKTEKEANAASVIKPDNPGRSLATSMFMDIAEEPGRDLGLNKLQFRVYNIIKQFGNQPGCPLDTILNQFIPQQHADVKNAIKFLMDEGHTYSTCDDYHYLATTVN